MVDQVVQIKILTRARRSCRSKEQRSKRSQRKERERIERERIIKEVEKINKNIEAKAKQRQKIKDFATADGFLTAL